MNRSAFLIAVACLLGLFAVSCSGSDDADGADDPATATETSVVPLRSEVVSGGGTSVDLGLDGPHHAVVIDEGGRCEGGGCFRVLELSSDGSWLLSDESGGTAEGTYDAQRFRELIDGINLDEIDLGEFRGQCPTAFDGIERSYLVYSPEDPLTSVLDLASCQDQIDANAPIVVELDLLITEAGR